MVNINTISHSYDPPLAKKDDNTSTDKLVASKPPLPIEFISINMFSTWSFDHQRVQFKILYSIPTNGKPNITTQLRIGIKHYVPSLPLRYSINFPTQRKKVLSFLGAMDEENSNVIAFKLDDLKSRTSHQLAFQLSMNVIGKKSHHTILDEGAQTLVMSLSYSRAIGSLEINRSPTKLKEFYALHFQPY